jgi:hypothetical protein
MTVDMTNNRVPYGLLTDAEKAALKEHEKAGGKIEVWHHETGWFAPSTLPPFRDSIYRTVPLPKTQDVIAWEKLPEWVEWVARDGDGMVLGYVSDPSLQLSGWYGPGGTRIDDFPGIVVQIGTCDWRDSKQRRPR